MSQIDVSFKHEEVLRNTVLTSETPGTILHDFQAILDFVAEGAMNLTNAHMLPMKVLEPLNKRLSRRIEHGLARPQQRNLNDHRTHNTLLLGAGE